MSRKRIKMSKEYIIIGNSSFSYMLYKYLREENMGKALAFVADPEYIDKKTYEGIPIIDFQALFREYSTKIELVMGIGYMNMGTVRCDKFRLCKDNGFSFANLIHPSCRIHSTVQMGEGNVLLEDVDIQSDAIIGDANLFLAGSFFGHDSIAGNFNTFCVKSVVTGYVEIKNHCFIGTLATMNNRITLEEFTFLGASTYASRSTNRNTVVMPSKCKYLEVSEGGYII